MADMVPVSNTQFSINLQGDESVGDSLTLVFFDQWVLGTFDEEDGVVVFHRFSEDEDKMGDILDSISYKDFLLAYTKAQEILLG